MTGEGIVEYKYISLEKEAGLGIVTISRPAALNALNRDLSSELLSVFTEIEQDKEIRVAILTGIEKTFIAGADILEMKDKNSKEALDYLTDTRAFMDKIYNLSKPVIAAVNGYAFGGGMETALACDLRIASEKAKFGLLEINLGVIPGAGGIQRLVRLIGMTKAKEMLFTGDIYDALSCYEMGFLNKVVPHDELMKEAKALAQKISDKSGVALHYAKKAINAGSDLSLPAALELDESLFALCFDSYDQKEGMTAFAEKRKAVFKNK